MSFSKINNSDFNGKGALSLPDQPTDAPQELKRKFDEDAREVVTPKFNNLIDELEASTSAASLGATAPSPRTGTTVQGVLNSISGDLATLEGSVAQVIADDHTHANKTILDGIDDNGSGKLTYNGSVVGETDYSNLSNKPSINSVTLSGNKTSSDLGLMPATTLATVATSGSYNDLSNKPTIPTALSDLTDDSTHRVVTDTEKTAWGGKTTVGWSQITTTGQKIATVTIDGTPTDVYAPTGGGGGGGGNVDSVNGQTGTVVLDINDINDTTLTSLSDQDILVYNGTAHVWENEALKDVALTGDYSDLSNTPTIPSVDQTYNAASANAQSGTAVKSAIDALDVSDSAISGQYVSAVSETDGKISVTRASLPSIPTVNSSALTIQKGSSNSYFYANANGAATVGLDYYLTSVTQADGKATFDNLNPNYGYDLYYDDDGATGSVTVPTWAGTYTKTNGTDPGTIKLAYDINGGVNGTSKWTLRVLK